MEKKEFLGLYDRLTNNYDTNIIDDLYAFSCLTCSGFDNDKAYELKGLLYELWLKDENDISMSKLSDALYENYDKIDFENLGVRGILVFLYEESNL